ncbi:unnamed protein product [Arctogadus glacialis]
MRARHSEAQHGAGPGPQSLLPLGWGRAPPDKPGAEEASVIPHLKKRKRLIDDWAETGPASHQRWPLQNARVFSVLRQGSVDPKENQSEPVTGVPSWDRAGWPPLRLQ